MFFAPKYAVAPSGKQWALLKEAETKKYDDFELVSKHRKKGKAITKGLCLSMFPPSSLLICDESGKIEKETNGSFELADSMGKIMDDLILSSKK